MKNLNSSLSPNRRRFLQTTATLAGAGCLPVAVGGMQIAAANDGAATDADQPWENHISCNEYPWRTFLKRAGKTFQDNLKQNIQSMADSGVNGIEPIVADTDYLHKLEPLLNSRSIEMRSLYVNSKLHAADTAATSIEQVVEIAKTAKDLFNTQIIVTNPEPIQWGGPENKSDSQLILQAEQLNRLGQKLKDVGVTLAYHNHDIELRAAARELHHMMSATDPSLVSLCLDSHWMYRGAGDSVVAWKDITNLYLDRVVELHLRQSVDGIWTESFGAGDLDYAWLFAQFKNRAKPLLVLEQAIEEKSAHKLNCQIATQQSREFLHKMIS